jgi:hypothetical protein
VKTLKVLIDKWSNIADQKPYIAKADEESIDHNLIAIDGSKGKTAFRFDFLPQPWWGNIKNPKVIVLALNPGIDETEKVDEENLREDILLNLKGKNTINWMSEGITSGHKWWKATFKDIIQSGLITPDMIYKKVGVFELIGYHSKRFNSGGYETVERMVNTKLGVISGVLPTQDAMFAHLSYLIKNTNPIVIIIWGQKFWRQKVVELEGYDYIDTINTASHSLSRNNLRAIDFERIIQKLLE